MSPYARLLRTAAGAAVAAVLLGGPPSFASAPATVPTAGYDAATTSLLYSQVNAHRVSLGLGALAVDARLADVAKSWTTKMAASGTLAHNDALFTPASHRSLGIKILGENVGDTWAPDRIQPMFLNSPHHRENIENPAYALAGFAVVVDATGQYWVTEDFGSTRAAAPAPVPASAPAVRRSVATPTPAPTRPRTAARTVTPVRTRTVTPRAAVAAVPPRAEATPRLDTAVVAAASPLDPVRGGGRTAWAAAAFLAAALAGSSLLRLRRRARLDG